MMKKKYNTNETTSAGSVAAVAAPLGGKKKANKRGMYNPDGTMKNALDTKQRIVSGKDKYNNKEENAMKKRTNENLGDMAHMAEQDHEVQMARADLYKIAKYAIKLHDMLRNISEREGLEGWQQAKITKASDYISSVYHNLDYSMKFDGAGELGEGKYKSDAQRKAIHAAKAKKESAYKKDMHEKLSEKLTKSMSAGDIIADFQSSDDPKFKGKSKEERKRMALGAYYDMHPEKSKKKVKEENGLNDVDSALEIMVVQLGLNENFDNGKKFVEPNFSSEWEEAERYPEFVKIGKEAWIELAKKGKAVTIKSAKGINNTDAADPDSFKSLDPNKQKRALAQLEKGTIEMPIVAVYSDGWKELVGGNTRLTAMMAQDGQATIWAFKVPDEVAKLAENFAEGKVKGKSKEERKRMALGAYYDMHPEKSKKKVKEDSQTLMTEEQFDEAAGEKDACYHKVKSRYKVWPSAYASAALSKCRKVGAKNWGNKSKKKK